MRHLCFVAKSPPSQQTLQLTVSQRTDDLDHQRQAFQAERKKLQRPGGGPTRLQSLAKQETERTSLRQDVGLGETLTTHTVSIQPASVTANGPTAPRGGSKDG